MDARTPGFSLDARDRERARDLARMKWIAGAVLAASVATLVAARIAERTWPAFSYLAAFAEAATIGGVADWYAVVVLFRRPFGLPIPHTAIIPENQRRIAEKLGEFIETHFLAPEPVAAKLREVDFARFAGDWLADPQRSASLARFALRLLPEALGALEQSGLKTYVARRIVAQLQGVDVGPLAAGALKAFTEGGRHQKLLDELLGAISRLIHERETMAALREKIRDELPSLLRLYRADAFLLKRIVASVTAFFEEVRNDPDHVFRGEFDRFLATFIEQLATAPDYQQRLEGLKRDLLRRPEFGDLARNLWATARGFLEEGAAEGSVLEGHVQRMLSEAGRHLLDDPAMRAEINQGMIVLLASFVESQKSGVSTFIAEQVKRWDIDQLVTLIEINIGRDLQHIRFNGALIGGLAGLTLHALEQALRFA